MTLNDILITTEFVYGGHYTAQYINFAKLLLQSERDSIKYFLSNGGTLEEYICSQDMSTSSSNIYSDDMYRYMQLVQEDMFNSEEALSLRNKLGEQEKYVTQLKHIDLIVENRKWELAVGVLKQLLI